MRLLLTLTVILKLTCFQVGLGADKDLLDCPDVKSMAVALTKLQQMDWGNVSWTQVKELWPSHLEGLDCDPKRCTSFRHQGRVINGNCECCTIMFFDDPPIDKEPSGPLQNIIVIYSASSRIKALEVVKILALSAGLPKEYIGHEYPTNYSQEIRHKGQKGLSFPDVTISQKGTLWEVRLSISRFVF